jgi:hypothetical protein
MPLEFYEIFGENLQIKELEIKKLILLKITGSQKS